jgi:7,8-dihydropterin-6-yl-methyl-4-(beta-D-ribofuranosyl)aminobenzene 5'-phosphate synthase
MKPLAQWLVLAGILLLGSAVRAADPPSSAAVHALKVTVLVTNLAGDAHEGDGEWGFSALVEVDGRKILYDTGSSPDMALRNAKALKIDLSDVEDVVLSHNHFDHVGGLLTLRRELSKINPRAMSRVHVGARIFEPRWDASGEDRNGLKLVKADYLATGGTIIVHEKPVQLLPGVWLTGPVPRPNDEKNWFPGLTLDSKQGRIEDNVPEDSALLFDTDSGMVILTGCAHAGIVNISEYARTILGKKPIVAVVGGLHLFSASDQALAWTGGKLKSYSVRSVLGAHCTGIEAVFRMREYLRLTRKTAIVGATGSSFTLNQGFDSRRIAQ